jgi:ATP-dependent DNA helicase RecG
VIRRLTADLKVPFVLRDGVRIDDTPVHQAVREALVNCLIHADYSDRASVRVDEVARRVQLSQPRCAAPAH